MKYPTSSPYHGTAGTFEYNPKIPVKIPAGGNQAILYYQTTNFNNQTFKMLKVIRPNSLFDT